MHALDHRIDGHDQSAAGGAIDQRRVVFQVETARPGQRREKPPYAAEFAKSLGHYSSDPRNVRARRWKTPLANAGSRPLKNA